MKLPTIAVALMVLLPAIAAAQQPGESCTGACAAYRHLLAEANDRVAALTGQVQALDAQLKAEKAKAAAEKPPEPVK